MRSIRIFVAAAATLLALLAGACGGEGGDGESPTAPATSTTEPTTSSTSTTESAATDDDGGETSTERAVDLRTVLGAGGVVEVIVDPTEEGGSHPTLSWQPVDGADSYWVVLLDGDGAPYWAWIGAETSVRVGGGDSADENQTATLHEAMTLTVTAFDAEGELLAISTSTPLAP